MTELILVKVALIAFSPVVCLEGDMLFHSQKLVSLTFITVMHNFAAVIQNYSFFESGATKWPYFNHIMHLWGL